jgi:hypothetical protein
MRTRSTLDPAEIKWAAVDRDLRTLRGPHHHPANEPSASYAMR